MSLIVQAISILLPNSRDVNREQKAKGKQKAKTRHECLKVETRMSQRVGRILIWFKIRRNKDSEAGGREPTDVGVVARAATLPARHPYCFDSQPNLVPDLVLRRMTVNTGPACTVP